jgi:hypothetical protein
LVRIGDETFGGGFQPVTEAEAIRWGEKLARDVRAILEKHPEADPDNVRHTLILLQMSPEERLARSLLRGGARAKRSGN